MDLLFLFVPWMLVALVTGGLIYRGRHAIDRTGLLVETAVVVLCYAAYYVVRALTAGSESAAIDNAGMIIDAQRWLRIYIEADVQELFAGTRASATAMNWIYIWWHWPVIITAAVWLFLQHRAAYTRYRNAFVLSGAVGLLFFALFPVAPPRLADAAFVDTLSRYSEAYRTFETPRLVNQYAAFPSLHFGWNLLVSIALVRESRAWWAKLIGVLSPPTVLIAIMATANHFLIDAAAGAAVCVGALLLAGARQRQTRA